MSDTAVSEGQQASLSCIVSVTSNESVGFMIGDDHAINTAHSSCDDTFENATRKCNNTFNDLDTVLICNYSESYKVDCTLQVTAPASTSTNVRCMVGDGGPQSVAGLIVARKYCMHNTE